MILKAFLLACVAFIGKLDLATDTNQIQRPIILGPIVGLIMGNLSMGVTIGATLELAFLGSYSVGAFIPPDVIVGGVLGTAFAIQTGKGPAVAFTMAFPIALLALIFDNVIFALVRPMLGKMADKYAAKGNAKAVNTVHMIAGFIMCAMLAIIVFVGYLLGGSQIKMFVNAIPKPIINGLTIATGLLPGIGFAMLAQMIMNKKILPFFFLGFLLSAYFKVPVIGIALLGLILVTVLVRFMNNEKTVKTETKGEDDNEF
ncbi:PTS mannose/fructose/sorbose/N-acetylgalactosamine transporter subunit IIC [Companilactobacillus pabuli]|uniref:PTS mannose/fructose/sorbose/N-acetylgalactosamine transporter subunit IIC n=1 Tax=Companilactobacillus pabuli TaxID=2714036 RepID=UPI002416E15E|nr:PTS sugar transporter subunit IIC [Companilactobacillus pabuli]MDG5114220.1 PTS sugar transporter subunit IIC [Companilactobacillus pabuli]